MLLKSTVKQFESILTFSQLPPKTEHLLPPTLNNRYETLLRAHRRWDVLQEPATHGCGAEGFVRVCDQIGAGVVFHGFAIPV